MSELFFGLVVGDLTAWGFVVPLVVAVGIVIGMAATEQERQPGWRP